MSSIIFMNMFTVSLSMAVVIILLLLLSKLFGMRVTAKCRYIIWVAIIIRLCIPLGAYALPSIIEVNIPAEVELAAPHTTTKTDIPVPIETDAVQVAPPASQSVHVPMTMPVPATDKTPEPSENTAEPKPSVVIDMAVITRILSYIWLAGPGIFLVWKLTAYNISAASLVRSSKPARETDIELYSRLCELYNIRRAPKLFVSEKAFSPMLYGYFRPLIIIPDIALSYNSLAGILAHELTHYRRRDLWMKLLCVLASSLHWWNPLVHIAAKRCNNEMELSCDEAVLAGLDEETRRSYGNVMLDIIKRCDKSSGTLTTQFNPKKNAVKERFYGIMDMTKKKRGLWIIAAVVLICIVAGMIVGCNIGNNGNTLPEGHWYAEGRYLSCDNGQNIIIMDAKDANPSYPCSMTAENDSVNFADLTDGDRIKIEVYLIEESYPAQTRVYSIEKLSNGERIDIDADILAQLVEMGWIMSDAALPDNFASIYAKAERVYALFTGYAKLEYGDKTISYRENPYRQVTEFNSIKELETLTAQYFTDELTDSLINTRVFGDLPLYYEEDGVLYRFDGYSALWSYDAAQKQSFEVMGDENSVSVYAEANEGGEHISAESVCKYVISDDGGIRFSEFNLMADVLFGFYSGNETEPPEHTTPAIDYGKYAVAATDDTVSDGYCVLFNYRTDIYKDDIIQCKIRLPHINLSKPNAEKWNAEIAETIFAAHNQCLYDLETTDTSFMFAAVDYELYTTSDIITISVTNNGGYLGTGAVYLEYLIYHYDTQNDRFLTTDEFLALYTGGKWTEAKIIEYLNDNGYNKDDGDKPVSLTSADIQGVLPSPLSDGGIEVCFQGYVVEATIATRLYVLEDSVFTASDGKKYVSEVLYSNDTYMLLVTAIGEPQQVLFPTDYYEATSTWITKNLSIDFVENGYVYLVLSANTTTGRIDDLYISLDTYSHIVSYGQPLVITSIDDWEKFGLTYEDYRYPFFKAFLERDTAALEKLTNSQSGLYDSYKQLQFGDYKITKTGNDYGEFNYYLDIEITQGTDALPAGNYQFVYNEYPGNCLQKVYPVNNDTNDVYAVLKALINTTFEYALDSMASEENEWGLTEYIIYRLNKENITAQDISDYAKKYLGIDAFKPYEGCLGNDGYYFIPGHGAGEIISEYISTLYDYDSGEYTVTVQFYSDHGLTVYSHRVAYRMKNDGIDWVFIGYEVQSNGEFEPYSYVT